MTSSAPKATVEPTDDMVYLDYAATAPVCQAAARAISKYAESGLSDGFPNANANALYSAGRRAFAALEEARHDIAIAIGAKRPSEVMFTSGATEADNAAIIGISLGCIRSSSVSKRLGDDAPHVVVGGIEHDAVLESSHELRRLGFEVTLAPPDRDGFVTVEAVKNAMRESTVLVSVQMANSETGAIMPVRQIAAAAHEGGALFHTDATQALGKEFVDCEGLGVDAASFSAHKIGGLKGTGALYLRAQTPFAPLMNGGGQEGGRRSGTQNVMGAVSFAAAAKEALCNMEEESARLRDLRDALYEHLSSFEGIEPSVEVERGSRDFLPNIVNVLFDGLESETLVLRFDELGFAVSGGSACASRSLEPSHVLTAMGISKDQALGELRVSMGFATTEEDARSFMRAVPKVLAWR